MAFKNQMQITQGLILGTVQLFCLHMRIGQLVGFAVITGKNGCPHIIQGMDGFGVVIVGGASGPKRLFIELQVFGRRITKDHCRNSAISNRQSLVPNCGRFVVPQRPWFTRTGYSLESSQYE